MHDDSRSSTWAVLAIYTSRAHLWQIRSATSSIARRPGSLPTRAKTQHEAVRVSCRFLVRPEEDASSRKKRTRDVRSIQKGIHDVPFEKFLFYSRYVSRIAKWIVRRDMSQMDQLAQEDHSYVAHRERERFEKTWFSRNVHLDRKQLRPAIEKTTLRWSLSFVAPKTQSCPAERDIPNLFPQRCSSHSGSRNSDRNDHSRKDKGRIKEDRPELIR